MIPFDVADARLSVISIAALEDQGYTVNYGAADPFAKTDLDSRCQCSRRELNGWDEDATYKPAQAGSKHRKTLSDVGREKAIEAGRAFLEGMPEPRERSNDGYVGGKGVFVYYEEDGRVYTVYAERS